MKRKMQIIGAYAVSVVAMSALAQDVSVPRGNGSDPSVVRTNAASLNSTAQDRADHDVDNTARNVRDRDDRTLTPLDQGESEDEVETTAQIRKEIIDNKNMSVNAKNVKIITRDGRVTLRGPVDSAEERRVIGEIAARIASSQNVDNQLEVVLTTSSK